MRPRSSAYILIVGLLAASCRKQAPAPVQPEPRPVRPSPCADTSAASGRNGFVLDGGGFTNTIIDLDSHDVELHLVEHYEARGVTQFTHWMSNVMIGRGFATAGLVDVRLQFTGLYGPGEYVWGSLDTNAKANGVIIRIGFPGDTMVLRSISGSTVMRAYNGIGRPPIKGRFCGLMVSNQGDTVAVKRGIFTFKE